jgi:hypothetical protein
MSSAPKISLMIAIYNRANLVPETLLVTGRNGSFGRQITDGLRFHNSQDG